jgi:hypothetical protein
MTKPTGVDQKLATTCTKCHQRILTAYGVHSEAECELNVFQAMVDKEELRWTPLTEEIKELLNSEHSSKVHQFKFNAGNGILTGVFVSKHMLEAIAAYNNMQMDMSLTEFIITMGM